MILSEKGKTMRNFDGLLKSTSYKAVYLYETQAAYIWQNGRCQYYPYLSPNQVNVLRLLSENAEKKFFIPDRAFGFSS
jgi:hypothetical protein